MNTEKTKETSGASEKTPSLPQYFSWINNTNEGATEKHTLINLEYFKWLHDRYGMELKIYAWDAGNLDGAGFYDDPLTSEKLKKQYPNGYGKCVEKAAEFGCRLGVWGGADGYGDTEEEEKRRHELLVSLCRDYHFLEFKFDTVCGMPREEKRQAMIDTINECRKYSPDLIVLNHRNQLGEAEIVCTTFLVDGLETYTDVWSYNTTSGPHHRMMPLTRDLTPGLTRLAEDHGVCLSSFLDYFEDDLILQAFTRNLILAPEIYGNPWFLRDDEQARLAKIYNVHAKYNDILVEGIALSEEKYGKNAVSRGNGETRLITFANPGWTTKTVCLPVSGEIGLSGDDGEYVVKQIHPYEKLLSVVRYGDEAVVTVPAARAVLVLVQKREEFEKDDFVLTGCEYETVYGPGAVPSGALIYSSQGNIGSMGNRKIDSFVRPGDLTHREPLYLGRLEWCQTPSAIRGYYEATAFAADTDSLEAQALRRSGDTSVPEVKAARDAFFSQTTYLSRGPEARFMFDGNDDTFFDAETSRFNTKINGGCLRVDLGDLYDISRIEITSFTPDNPISYAASPVFCECAFISPDLDSFGNSHLRNIERLGKFMAPVVGNSHLMTTSEGELIRATYDVNGRIRYFGLPSPMGRIYSFKIFGTDGREITGFRPHANNTLSPFDRLWFKFACSLKVRIPEDVSEGSYIAVGTDGEHGKEGVYCGMDFEGEKIGAYDRACCYPMNNWEYIAASPDSGYTYYFRIEDRMKGREVTLYSFYVNFGVFETKAWLCDPEYKGYLEEIEL